jgi:hypothetical protein
MKFNKHQIHIKYDLGVHIKVNKIDVRQEYGMKVKEDNVRIPDYIMDSVRLILKRVVIVGG